MVAVLMACLSLLSMNQNILIYHYSRLYNSISGLDSQDPQINFRSQPIALVTASGTRGIVGCGTPGNPRDGAEPHFDAPFPAEKRRARGGPEAGQEQSLSAPRPPASSHIPFRRRRNSGSEGRCPRAP